jgi:hypothetical protein
MAGAMGAESPPLKRCRSPTPVTLPARREQAGKTDDRIESR